VPSRASWDGLPDQDLVDRHEREIFPLLRKRYLFAHVENFLLYDFFTSGGSVNENIYAYSNRYGDERGLVVYNNKFENASGWIRTSVGFAEKPVASSGQNHVQKALGEGLALHNDPGYFCIFTDHANGLELIRNSRELCEEGLYVELGAYNYHVFLDFREVQDNVEQHYAQLCAYLDGRGVPSVDEAMKEFFLQPLHQTFTAFMNAGMVQELIEARASADKPQVDHEVVKKTDEFYALFLDEVKGFISAPSGEHVVAEEVHNSLEVVLQLENLEDRLSSTSSPELEKALKLLEKQISDVPFTWCILFSWIFVRDLGKILSEQDFEAQSRSWVDEWLLGKIISSVFTDLDFDEQKSWYAVSLIKILTSHQNWFEVNGSEKGRTYRTLKKLLEDQEIQQFIGINRYQDVLWFNQEAFESLLSWLTTIAIVDSMSKIGQGDDEARAEIVKRINVIRAWRDAEKVSDYQVDKLLEALK